MRLTIQKAAIRPFGKFLVLDMHCVRCRTPLASSANGTWIPCSEKLPHANEYVLYCTAQYEALGKRDRETWWRSAFSLEPEENPVLYWRPVLKN